MTNAKTEFLEELKEQENRKLLCAKIGHETSVLNIILKKRYTKKDFDEFLQELDFEYDSGYGDQEVFGIIWFDDGTWCERYEYDGSEHWEHKECPDWNYQ